MDTTEQLLSRVRRLDGHETEFIQAVEEVLHTLGPVFDRHPEYVQVMERLMEPERVISFRVAWLDDAGRERVIIFQQIKVLN